MSCAVNTTTVAGALLIDWETRDALLTVIVISDSSGSVARSADEFVSSLAAFALAAINAKTAKPTTKIKLLRVAVDLEYFSVGMSHERVKGNSDSSFNGLRASLLKAKHDQDN
ncbi:hypothetical protein [Pararobbsia alpina]|uniref:hypothetical protein n=1 Tax=Pararobbsia alpina TaxID=621374 RepID=UPI0039A713E3